MSISIDLEEILTTEEIASLPFSSSYTSACIDFVERTKMSCGQEAVYVGQKDTYFPDPVTMTASEIEDFIDFWMTQQERNLSEDDEQWQTRDQISNDVYDAAKLIDDEIIDKVWTAIKSALREAWQARLGEDNLNSPLGEGTFPSASEYIDAGIAPEQYDIWYKIGGWNIDRMKELHQKFGSTLSSLGEHTQAGLGNYDHTIAYKYCNGDLSLEDVKQLVG